MENVECLNIENKSVKNFTYDVAKKELHLNTNEYVSNLIKELNDEILKLCIEPGECDFEYNDDNLHYHIYASNLNDRWLIRGKIEDCSSKFKINQRINNIDSLLVLGEMCGGIVHDLANQLMINLNSCEMLKIKHSENYRKLIYNTAKTAKDTIHGLLSFLRNEVTSKMEINLCNIIDEVIMLFNGFVRKKIVISKEINETEAYILGERKSLLNVLLNLLINSADAIDKYGHIIVRLEMINLAFLPKNSAFQTDVFGTYYKLTITDDGKGIDEEDLKYIFTPFFTTKRTKGTGLGLSNAALVIENHNGIIACSSTTNIGTSFQIYLPAINAYHNKNVLVVSDDKDYLFKAKQIGNHYHFEFYYKSSIEASAFYNEYCDEISYVISDYPLSFKTKMNPMITDIYNFKEIISKL